MTGALPIVEGESATTAWFAVKIGPTTFGTVDVFSDEASRQAYLTGPVAAALMARADDLFASPPKFEQLDILASRLPSERYGGVPVGAAGGRPGPMSITFRDPRHDRGTTRSLFKATSYEALGPVDRNVDDGDFR